MDYIQMYECILHVIFIIHCFEVTFLVSSSVSIWAVVLRSLAGILCMTMGAITHVCGRMYLLSYMTQMVSTLLGLYVASCVTSSLQR
jgi:hypothetical protein